MPTVRLHPDPPATAFIRGLICHALGGGSAGAAVIAAESCKTTPQLAEFFAAGGFAREQAVVAQYRKTGVPAGSTGGSHWLDDMAPYGVGREGFQLLQSASLFGQLSLACRRVPFRTKFPREYGAGAGSAWRGEGLPRPVMQTLIDQLTQDVFEASTVFVVTREVLAFGQIAEAMLRAIVAAAVAKWIDGQLLDPTVTATSARPGSLTNGATEVTSTGSSAAQIIADLSSLIAAITTPGDSLRWVMRPTTLAYINAKLAGVGYPTTPGFLLGIPALAGSTSPHQVALIDAGSIAVSYDDVMTIDINTQTSVEMSDAPTQSAISGAGAQMVSMFQTRAAAIKATLNVAWQPAYVNLGSPAQPSGVSFASVNY